jgi:N-dimethylarginine dimethylaminohydrolase
MERPSEIQGALCFNEYDPLIRVLLCSPHHMEINEVINRVQEEYAKENIDKERAVKQHQYLAQTLEKHEVEIIHLPVNEEYPEQVFSRDIGFTIGNVVCVAQMERPIRQGEEEVLKKWLSNNNIPYYVIKSGTIEGGDVIIDRDKVWVGRSDRTSIEAINELQTIFPQFDVHSLPIDGKYLHLDCIFNVLSEKEALVYTPAFTEEQIETFAKHYHLIEVFEEEQFTLGTNVLSIGKKKIVSLPQNERVNEQLKDHGYQIIPVDISEIIKSGGSFRCITMPLNRRSTGGNL